jgi:hypothetical protein
VPTFRVIRREMVESAYMVESESKADAIAKVKRVQPENQLDLYAERSGVKLIDTSVVKTGRIINVEYFG